MSNVLQQYLDEERAYHESSAEHRSDVLNFAISPAHYDHFKRNPKTQTPAMKFGEAYHFAILEPHKFELYVHPLSDDVKAEPEKGWTSKANQQAKSDFIANTPIVLEQSEFDQIRAMRDKLYQKQYILDLLEPEAGGRPEVTRSSKLYGLDVEVKIDWHHPAYNLDLKTDQSAAIKDFQRSIINKRYYFQAGMYCDVDCGCEANMADPKPFGFIAQEKTAPFEVSLHWVNHELIAKGIEEYRDLVRQISTCHQLNMWPGYEYWSMEMDNSFRVEPPFWMKNGNNG